MLLIVLMLSSLPTIRSRTCVDDVKGLCHAHDIFGWCYHDKVTGTFNCDDESFCANQTQLKGKVNSTGCFDRGADNIKCCCNEASMCNYNFIHVEPIVMMNTSQSCKYSYEKPDADIVHFKNCVDPWCIAFISANVEGGPSAVLRGCQSRILQKLTTDKKRTNPDPNTIIFYGMDELLRQPRCQEIVGADRPENGTQRACLDIFYMVKSHIYFTSRLQSFHIFICYCIKRADLILDVLSNVP
ncbi:unnamed protein product [Toxocara canis]|uniref:UPAR/Ly6 domain-containing protein n=1 Tax=Toxocara canis TaxID=6265 RepID=A0A183UTP5_TOXCA|nr:unnamed protein product [Toxocara canis]